MIEQYQVVRIHKILIDNFGGSHGLRDANVLESALKRPDQTFDGHDLYPSLVEKAAAVFESIVKNHPFIDGNKRIGYVLLRMTLLNADQDIVASEDDKYEFVIQVSEGKLDFDEITNWIQQRVKKK